MSLANVISLHSGTNFIINVAAAQLSSDVTEKDFTVLHNGTAVSNVNYNKTTPNTLTYVGASLPSTTVEIRRKTSFDQSTNLVTYANRFQTDKWNDALLRIQRWEEEVDLNGAGSIGAGVIPIPANDAYGAVWTNDTIYSPTRKALWDKIETLAPKASPALTGVPTAPTASHANTSTQLATTAHVKNVLGNTPAITNPTVSNGNFTSPTISTPAITGGTLASSAISGATITTSTLTAPSLTGAATSTNYGSITSGSSSIATHSDVNTELINRLLVVAARTNTQPANNGTYTVATFDSVARNISNCFNGATGIFTAPFAGWYSISVYMSFTASGGTVPSSIRTLVDIGGVRLFDAVTPSSGVGLPGQTISLLTQGQQIFLNCMIIPSGGTGFTLTLGGSGVNRMTVQYLGS